MHFLYFSLHFREKRYFLICLIGFLLYYINGYTGLIGSALVQKCRQTGRQAGAVRLLNSGAIARHFE